MVNLREESTKYWAQKLLADICLQTSEVVAGDKEGVEEMDRDAPEVFTQLLQSCVEPPSNNQGKEPTDEPEQVDMRFVSAFFTSPATEIYEVTAEHFLSACADSGAQRTIIGIEQAVAYSVEFGAEVVTRWPTRAYVFGSGRHRDVGTLSVHILVTHNT